MSILEMGNKRDVHLQIAQSPKASYLTSAFLVLDTEHWPPRESTASLFLPNSNLSRVDVSRQSQDGQKREYALARTSCRTRRVYGDSNSSHIWKGPGERPKHRSRAVHRTCDPLSCEHRHDGLHPDEQEHHVRKGPL